MEEPKRSSAPQGPVPAASDPRGYLAARQRRRVGSVTLLDVRAAAAAERDRLWVQLQNVQAWLDRMEREDREREERGE